ncbi:MAG: DNA polymerase Y family protein [Bradyrhizobiaceae bacterium]|nr:DNA polymerase Y family protein [Bradyrhizobiaceae bacterium]
MVLAADAAAQRAGIKAGMAMTKAQILVQDLIVMKADPPADAAALDRMALWALRYAPIAAADPPDGLVIDATGAAHLHGGETAMLDDVVGRLAAAGYAARAAIADSWDAAHAFARFVTTATAPVIVVPPGDSATAVGDLPVEALRLPAEMAADLRALGFASIGDLADKPRAPLTLRFGPALVRCLDQAMGQASQPIDPVRSPDLVEVRRVFAEPIAAAETIARYTGKLVAALCAALEARGLGARRLDLLFHLVDNRIAAIRIGTARPLRDAKRLTRLLHDRIETVDPGFGIEIMRLAAPLAEPLPPQQRDFPFAGEAEGDISALIDTLTNRVGCQRLYRFAPVESDVPARCVRRVAPLSPATSATWADPWPRPARLLPVPEPIVTVALLPDHPPVTFTWRGIRHRVSRADGPERVFGEWWKHDTEAAAVRDYFRVENDAGERFWIYRCGDGEDGATGSQRWFLHGIFP